MKRIERKLLLIGVVSLFITLFPYGMVHANENESVAAIQTCELSDENSMVDGFKVETRKTMSEDGFLVEETGIPISQLIFIGANESNNVIKTSQLDEAIRSDI